ncbi:hypothetical protein OQA88_5249 [Cercophora sp. LCS_1]
MPVNTRNPYFLVPAWDITPAILGSILTHPAQPHACLSSRPITTCTSSQPTTKTIINPSGNGLFSAFLHLAGLGNEEALVFDRTHILSYSIKDITSHSFDPSAEFIQAVLADGRVAMYRRASGNASLFLVMGIKTVKGAGVTISSRRGKGWELSFGVEGEEEVVFAYRVVEVDGEGKVVDHEWLGEEEGFSVADGMEEENGQACSFVVGSLACVDLLTASSSRIGYTVSQRMLGVF